MRARRRPGERDHPAARARQARQRPFGHRPDHVHVDDLRPPRARGLRAVQGSLAAAAFRRRPRCLPLTGIRVPGQAFALVPGLTAPLAVLAPLPLGFLPLPAPGLTPLLRRDALLRRRRPGVGAVLAQPAFQLRNPQLQPPVPLQRSVQLGPQHRVLSVLRLDHGPQPSQQLTLLPGISRRTRHIGHEPRSCSTATTGSSTPHDVSRRPHPHPVNGHAPSCFESYSCSTLRSIFDVNTKVQFHFVGSMKICIEIISENLV